MKILLNSKLYLTINMIDLSDPVIIAPVGALIIAILGLVLVYRSTRSQSLGVKLWLLIFMATWIPWSGATIMMRFASNETLAIIYLRISLISLQIAYFALFRFHHLLVFRTTDRRFSSIIVTVLVSFNIALAFNKNMLGVNKIGDFYTDSFHILMQLSNLFAAGWAGTEAFKALRELDMFSTFYTPDGERKPFQMLFSLGILLLSFIILIVWIAQAGPVGVSPDATLFIFFSWLVIGYFAFTYGVRPLSTILSPQRVWAFIVIDYSGIPIFTKSFSEAHDYVLFAGAIKAANSMIQIRFNSPTSIDLVTFDDRAVMVRTVNDLLFCLVVDHNSAQFEIILNDIVSRIILHDEYKELDFSSPRVDPEFMDIILADILEM